jgi:hypothetical protein
MIGLMTSVLSRSSFSSVEALDGISKAKPEITYIRSTAMDIELTDFISLNGFT